MTVATKNIGLPMMFIKIHRSFWIVVRFFGTIPYGIIRELSQPLCCDKMTAALLPYTRLASDGTYEVLVPLADCDGHYVLPYSFHSEDACSVWIGSKKGSDKIEHLRALRDREPDYFDRTQYGSMPAFPVAPERQADESSRDCR